MKILSASQIKEADVVTIETQNIKSIELMERAALKLFEWITNNFTTNDQFIIFCGNGNNGGDGLALSRLLLNSKYSTTTIIVNHTSNKTRDFNENYNTLKTLYPQNIIEVNEFKELNFNLKNEIIIDCLLGIGINKPLNNLIKNIVDYLNKQKNIKIAVDIPTGLFADTLNAEQDSIIKANYTLTFEQPKLSFMFADTAKYVGEFVVLPIQIDPKYLINVKSNYFFLTKTHIQNILKVRPHEAHKGNFGHALIIAGSKGKIGAATLSTHACLRSGVGLVTVNVPQCGYHILQTSIPEAMVVTDNHLNFITSHIKLDNYTAIGIGPGIGVNQETQNVFKLVIQNTTTPLIIDADAINILSENKTWISFLPANSILTPHPKEFERLVGKCNNSYERLLKQTAFAVKYNVYLILKGAHTSIACPNGEIYFNSTGNSGMATGGSGDVLTGILTSLLAQKYPPLDACLIGVYIHGLAGDFAAENLTEECMIASDIIKHLPHAFKYLKNSL